MRDKITNKIPVENNDGITIANLIPISFNEFDLKHIAKLLSKWRNNNKSCFLTEFEVTEDSTLSWINNFWLSSDNQELFLVEFENRFVGHFGYKNLTESSVLLDNAIRGEPGGEAKLFYYVGLTLIDWIFKNTSVNRIDGAVFDDNIPAIMMNRQLGFEGWDKVILKKVKDKDNISWKKTVNPNEHDELRSMFEIHINRINWKHI